MYNIDVLREKISEITPTKLFYFFGNKNTGKTEFCMDIAIENSLDIIYLSDDLYQTIQKNKLYIYQDLVPSEEEIVFAIKNTLTSFEGSIFIITSNFYIEELCNRMNVCFFYEGTTPLDFNWKLFFLDIKSKPYELFLDYKERFIATPELVHDIKRVFVNFIQMENFNILKKIKIYNLIKETSYLISKQEKDTEYLIDMFLFYLFVYFKDEGSHSSILWRNFSNE